MSGVEFFAMMGVIIVLTIVGVGIASLIYNAISTLRANREGET